MSELKLNTLEKIEDAMEKFDALFSKDNPPPICSKTLSYFAESLAVLAKEVRRNSPHNPPRASLQDR